MAHKNKSNTSPYKTRLESRGLKAPVTRMGKHRTDFKVYGVEEANDRLYDLFKNHDFSHINHLERKKLAEFYVLLMEKQKNLNMTRLTNITDIGIKHFIDCLEVSRKTVLKFPLLDLGTGPGFPGLPLKIIHPEKKIILAEGVQKRVEFLKEVREKLALQELPIVGRNINPWFFYPVNGVITRAVEDISNTLENIANCLQTYGRIYFMKGPGVDPEIDAALKKHSEYYKLAEDVHYELPKTPHKRRLVVFEKIKMSPYPDPEDEPWPGENDPQEHLC